ncbi:MAG: hypothetical protein GY829_12675 [Gammaproteobacteria bacterium]|nr:hypothetical protein [Gammaproteobacteria bacterium]
MIEFIWNIDFAKNIVAELIGVTLEVFIIFKIVSYFAYKKSKKNFTNVISSTINHFVTIHNQINPKITTYGIAETFPLKFKMWSNEVINQINEFSNLRLYEYFPALNKHLIEYKYLLEKIKFCLLAEKYDPTLFDEIVSKYKQIYDNLEENSLLKDLDYWSNKDLQEIKQQLNESSWKL